MLSAKHHIWRWLKSILAVFSISLIIFSFLSLYLLQELKQNIVQMNTTLNAYIQKSADSRLDEVHRYLMSVEISRANVELKNMTETPEVIPSSAYRLSTDFRNYIVTNKLVDGIYIYYPFINLTIGNLGGYQAEQYYQLQAVPSSENYDAWSEDINQEYEENFVLLSWQKGKKFCYIQDMYHNKQQSGVLAAEINTDQLLQAFSPQNESATASAATGVLLSGDLVAYTGDENLRNMIGGLYTKWKQTGKSFLQQRNTFVFFNHSEFKGLDYVSIYEANGVLQPFYISLTVCVTGAILCILVGIIGSVLLSIKNARPLNLLLSTIGEEYSSENDEYTVIRKKIEQMMAEQYKTEQSMRDYQNLLNSIFIQTVLDGNYGIENDIFSAAKRYGISFEYTFFRVIVLDGVEKVKDIPVLSDEISEIAEALKMDVIPAIYDKQYVLVVNTEDPDSEEKILNLVYILIDQLFNDKTGCVGVSESVDTMKKIYQCYLNARSCFSDMIATKKHAICFYENKDSGCFYTQNETDNIMKIPVVQKAKRMLEEQFQDPMMGLYLLSEQFHVTNSYLSTAFKNTYQIGIIKYLNQLRIERAKELILTTDLNIKEIAEEVGFASDINFIRVFKKLENCTPSELRKESAISI